MPFDHSRVGEPNCQLHHLVDRLASSAAAFGSLRLSAVALAAATDGCRDVTQALASEIARDTPGATWNASVTDAFAELVGGFTSATGARHESRVALDRIALLTSQFEKHASSLLPAHHDLAAPVNGQDGNRALESWAVTCFQVRENKSLARESEAVTATKIAAAEQLKRQVTLAPSNSEGTPALQRQADAAQEQAAEAARELRELQGKLQLEVEHEAKLAREVEVQAQQFEHDRVELLQLALGDFIHSQIALHSKSLELFGSMAGECDGMRPQNIESEIELGAKPLKQLGETGETIAIEPRLTPRDKNG
jgi:hypothetical protein